MKRTAAFLFVVLLGLSSLAETVVLTHGVPVDQATYRVVDVAGKPALEAYSLATGTRVGRFPALVDESARVWVPIVGGDLAAAEAALAARLAETAAEDEQILQDSKSLSRKLLENEWFDLADEIALAAGDSPVAEADARDLSKLRAKLKKAKDAKDAAAGQSKKAKADDLLEINELRGRLLLIDAELSAEDPGWKKNAKRHSVP